MLNITRSFVSFTLVNIIIFILGVVSSFWYLTLPFMFDAPGSTHSIHAWAILLSVLAMPITCFGSVAVSLYKGCIMKNYSVAMNVLRIPLVNLLLLVVLFII